MIVIMQTRVQIIKTNKERREIKLYLIAQRGKRILVFAVLHEIPVIVDEKYQCMGVFLYLYSCLGLKKKEVVTWPSSTCRATSDTCRTISVSDTCPSLIGPEFRSL